MRPSLLLQVAPTSGVPIYRQLLDQVKAHVAGGHLAAGEFLPSVRQLAEQLQINPMTVSRAYSLLEEQGIVELVRGQGMRVLPPGPAANGKAREQAILPLLQHVAEKARQLSLSPQQILDRLKPLLKEESHD